jgi:Sec-independent protein secretion pathway component TatC
MMEKLKRHKQYLYLSAIIIALGITFTTIFNDTVGIIGIIFIVIGGLFFVIGMSKKRNQDKRKDK